MSYPEAVWERAMKVQAVILKALIGELHWYRAADILGFSPRTLRRWRERYEQFGYEGLLDGRRRSPSAKRAPVAEVTRVVQLYRDTYRGFNARHFQDVDTARQCSDVMQRQLGQMSRVVEDLVDATRWARGNVALQKRRIDLRDVIRDAAADATSDVASAAGHFRQET
jgi:Winged helix-turn helix